jgi:hypothetical protein
MTIPQVFKRYDDTEKKMYDSGNHIIEVCDLALDEFYENGFTCSPFLLMLYDEGRIPFSTRIPRDAFVSFIIGALENFPFIGTFEIYLFIIRSIFGSISEIFFTVPAPGKLSIDISASAALEFNFVGRETVDGVTEFFDILDDEGNTLVFRGIPGINNAYELGLMFSEIMPAGIVPDISIQFFNRSNWVSVESGDYFNMVTEPETDQIVFYEIGA